MGNARKALGQASKTFQNETESRRRVAITWTDRMKFRRRPDFAPRWSNPKQVLFYETIGDYVALCLPSGDFPIHQSLEIFGKEHVG